MTTMLPVPIPARAQNRQRLNETGWLMVLVIAGTVVTTAIGAILEIDVATIAVTITMATIVITLLLFLLGKRQPQGIRSLPVGSALLMFLIVSALSTQIADMAQIRYDGPAMWRQFGLAMLPVILFWGSRSWAWHDFDVRAVDIGIMILLGACAASVLLDYVGILVFESYGNRHFGFLGDSVAWVATLPTVYFLVRGKLPLFVLCIALMLLTQTRAALLVVGVAIMLYFLLSPSASMRTTVMRIGMVLVGLVAAFFAQDLVMDIFARFQDTDLFENDRTRTIQFTLDVFWDRPWIGSGYNAHAYFFLPYQATITPANSQLPVAVSTPLQILADAGVLGFAPFIAAVVMLCWISLRALRVRAATDEAQVTSGLAAWLVAFLIFDQSAAWLIPLSLLPSLVFFSAGIVVATTSRARMRTVRPRA